MSSLHLFFKLSVLLILSIKSSSLSTNNNNIPKFLSQDNTHSNKAINRLTFLQTTISSSLLLVVPNKPAYAKASDKGTKKDPEYQACISLCVYECTKPKGDEQKTRMECLPGCKAKCATTKEQLLTGKPIQK